MSLSKSGATDGSERVTVRGLAILKTNSISTGSICGLAPAIFAERAIAERQAASADPCEWITCPLITFIDPCGIGCPSTKKLIT
jgi:hypothetical protein